MNNIKKIMNNKGIGFNELQKGTDISKSTLSPLVNSDEIPKKTKIDTLERISQFLNVSLLSLLESFVTITEFKYDKIKSTPSTQFYYYQNYSFCISVHEQKYEVDKKIEYYLTLYFEDEDKYLDWLPPILGNSSYNDVSFFLELSLNRFKLDLPNHKSSFIEVEAVNELSDGMSFLIKRVAAYSIENKFFNLMRKKGNSYETKREFYDIDSLL